MGLPTMGVPDIQLSELFMSATEYTPEVRLSASGELLFKGKCYPENGCRGHKASMDWLDVFFAQSILPR